MEDNPYNERIKYIKSLRSSRFPWTSEALISAAEFLDEEYIENRRTIRWEYLNNSQRDVLSFQVKNNAKELGALITFWMKCGNVQYWKGMTLNKGY